MKQYITAEDMAQQLKVDGENSFSPLGCKALADYLDAGEDEDAIFNTTEIRCAWSEYKNFKEFSEQQFSEDQFNFLMKTLGDEQSVENHLRDVVNDCTEFVEFEEGILVKNF